VALPDKRKISIWLAIKNPVFKGYWVAALASGTCVAAHNTAAFSVLGQESDSQSSSRSCQPLLTFYANVLLVVKLFLMAFVNWPYAFLLLAALGGAGWTLSATELWIAAQRTMPDWARGRLNATIVMCSHKPRQRWVA
jgi:hypothetical protein